MTICSRGKIQGQDQFVLMEYFFLNPAGKMVTAFYQLIDEKTCFHLRRFKRIKERGGLFFESTK